MKILEVVHRFPPSVKGGTMSYALALSRELANTNAVHVLYTRKDLAASQYTVNEGEYQGLPFTEIIQNGLVDSFEQTYRDPAIDRIFADLVDRLRPDVIHLHHLLFLSSGIVREARARGIPIVFTLHDFWLMCPREIRMKPADQSLCFEIREAECSRCIRSPAMTASRADRWMHGALRQLGGRLGPGALDRLRGLQASLRASPLVPLARSLLHRGRSGTPADGPSDSGSTVSAATGPIEQRNAFMKRLCRDVDLFISPSRFLREEYVRFGVDPARILYSRHGHDTSWLGPRPGRPAAGGKLRFGYVGMLARHKGCDVLIDAFNAISPDSASLDVFGTANVNLGFARGLERSAQNPSIRFHGGFEHHELARVFRGIDVLVMTSKCFENAPMTICEAFMAGVPVVASRLGGMAELVEDGRNGLLFTPGDPADLKRTIRRLIDEPGLVDQLSRGIEPIKTIEQDARDFCERVSAL